jgi:hypothetical protein
MFNDQELSVGGWIIFWILMAIPVINVIVFLVILCSKDSNRTLRNMLLAGIVLAVIAVVLVMTILAPIIAPIWDEIKGIIFNI